MFNSSEELESKIKSDAEKQRLIETLQRELRRAQQALADAEAEIGRLTRSMAMKENLLERHEKERIERRSAASELAEESKGFK